MCSGTCRLTARSAQFRRQAELTGTLFINGAAGKLSLGSINGGTIDAAGAIASLSIGGPVANADVLSGVNLGADALPGGAGAAADTFAAGAILKLKVSAPSPARSSPPG